MADKTPVIIETNEVNPRVIEVVGTRVHIKRKVQHDAVVEAAKRLLARRDQLALAINKIRDDWDSATAAQRNEITKQVLLGLLEMVGDLLIVQMALATRQMEKR